jgi:hypothetical protein
VTRHTVWHRIKNRTVEATVGPEDISKLIQLQRTHGYLDDAVVRTLTNAIARGKSSVTVKYPTPGGGSRESTTVDIEPGPVDVARIRDRVQGDGQGQYYHYRSDYETSRGSWAVGAQYDTSTRDTDSTMTDSSNVPAEWFEGSYDSDPTTEADGPGGDNDLDSGGVDRDWSDPDNREYLRDTETPDNQTGVGPDTDIPGGQTPGDQTPAEGGMPDQPTNDSAPSVGNDAADGPAPSMPTAPSIPSVGGVGSTGVALLVGVIGAVAVALAGGND